jgi:hypothetical protein
VVRTLDGRSDAPAQRPAPTLTQRSLERGTQRSESRFRTRRAGLAIEGGEGAHTARELTPPPLSRTACCCEAPAPLPTHSALHPNRCRPASWPPPPTTGLRDSARASHRLASCAQRTKPLVSQPCLPWPRLPRPVWLRCRLLHSHSPRHSHSHSHRHHLRTGMPGTAPPVTIAGGGGADVSCRRCMRVGRAQRQHPRLTGSRTAWQLGVVSGGGTAARHGSGLT